MSLETSKSTELYRRAVDLLPGGVNSPVRAFKYVGGNPLFIDRGQGAYIWDIDGNRFVDYVGSWGPLILGHAHPLVVAAATEAVQQGSSFGAPTAAEVEMAQLVCEAVPSVEKVRMVNSGTEAVMGAIRAARGFTGRDKIIKFTGCYHGHSDGLLVKAGSGAATLGIPDSPGVPAGHAQDTLTAGYNDIDGVREILDAVATEVAAIIVEPVVGNSGVIPPKPGFLEGLRELTLAHGVVLIFDEVMTGFRVAYGGAQELFGVTPDMTTLGKVIGGGFPVGAYGGRADIMAQVAPEGPVYQAGTLSGNPVAMAAGITTLRELQRPGFYEQLEQRSAALGDGLRELCAQRGVVAQHHRVGSMLSVFFTDVEVIDGDTAGASDDETFTRYFRGMLERGIYLAPSKWEAGFVSAAHSAQDVADTLAAAEEVLAGLSQS